MIPIHCEELPITPKKSKIIFYDYDHTLLKLLNPTEL
jgi:hypothetical protein